MGIELLEIVWSFFTGNTVNYKQILWDYFLKYIPKEATWEDATELTFAKLDMPS